MGISLVDDLRHDGWRIVCSTVIGDVVNTASRLESANKTTGTTILVTDAVRDKTVADIEYGRRFDLDLPGKDGQVVAHEPVGLID